MKRLLLLLFAVLGIIQIYAQPTIISLTREQGAKYLIICYDRYFRTVQRLAQWKNKKGILTKVVKISEIGDNKPQVIKDYISDCYNSWEQIPEYVLLVGDINNIAPYPHPAVGASDNPYADVNNDTLLELKIGRLPCHNKRQLYVMINKIFNYERKPYLGDTMFYKQAMTIRQDPGPYHNAGVEFVRGVILGNSDFTVVDTLYNPAHNKFDVQDSIKSGRAYVFYTGHGAGTHWPAPFNVNAYVNNKMKTPVIFSWSCQTVLKKNYYGQKWLKAGSPRFPRGAVAYLGTTTSGLYARYRNFVARNFMRSIFQNKTLNIGQALKEGLDSLWQYTPDSFGHTLYSEFNLLGDPEMNLWTAVPKPMTVVHPPNMRDSWQGFNLNVANADSQAVANALVCLSAGLGNDFYHYGYTDSAGNIDFSINPSGYDSIFVTVTAQNFIPYEASCRVTPKTANTYLSGYESERAVAKVAPNPARTYINIKYQKSNIKNTNTILKIYDAQGRVVKELGRLGVEELRVDLAGIKPGVYFVKIEANRQIETQRLIIIR